MDIFPLSGELGEGSFAYARGVHRKRNASVVIIKDDEGNYGIGESGVGDPLSIAYIVRELIEPYLGKEYTYNFLVEDIYTRRFKYNEEGAAAYSALSAIDIALNDLLAKERNISVVDELGGVVRKEAQL